MTNGNPKVDTGAYPSVANTGWGQSWTTSSGDLPASVSTLQSNVKCSATYQTWTDTVDTNEAYPINCVNWYEAFAFCIRDGGRLPTEAEWEYVAAGGAQNRLYPWGHDAPDSSRVRDGYSNNSPFLSFESKGVAGASYFGVADLAGSMWEWGFDWYVADYYGGSGTVLVCNDCANASVATERSVRGGSWASYDEPLRPAYRSYYVPTERFDRIGFRCVR